MESNEQARNRLVDTENRLAAVRGMVGGMGERVEGIKKKNKNAHKQRHQCGAFQREEQWGQVDEGKRGGAR